MPWLTRDRGRLYYEIDGPVAAPCVAFAHALGTDCSLWNPQISVLAQRFRVLRYDLRGHGRSAPAPGEHTLEELAHDLLALLDALAIERAHVCGISIGGLIAQWLGIHAPARVLRLVLSNTAARIGTYASWSERMALVEREGLAPFAEGAVARWLSAGFRAREPDLFARFCDVLKATDLSSYVGCCAALRDADLRASVARIQTDTLVIAGAHDPTTTRADGEVLVAQIPRARLLVLPAAHLANVEAAAAFTSALAEFLE